MWLGLGVFSSHQQAINSYTPAGCLIIQLNSDTIFLDLALDSTCWGLSHTRLPLSPISEANPKARQVSPVLPINQL